jgi:hypothetical protein
MWMLTMSLNPPSVSDPAYTVDERLHTAEMMLDRPITYRTTAAKRQARYAARPNRWAALPDAPRRRAGQARGEDLPERRVALHRLACAPGAAPGRGSRQLARPTATASGASILPSQPASNAYSIHLIQSSQCDQRIILAGWAETDNRLGLLVDWVARVILHGRRGVAISLTAHSRW